MAHCYYGYENTDDKSKLTKIFKALDTINKKYPVVLPLHPRTKKLLKTYGIKTNITIIDPVGYLEMISLIKNSKGVVTDSGGLQKEAYFFKKQGFTLRDQTEWVELIEAGCNRLIDVEKDDIAGVILENLSNQLDYSNAIYGTGNTSEKIIEALKMYN